MKLSLFSLVPGVRVDEEPDLYEAALARAELADELGFHCFWVAEHHARSISKMPSPAVFLAAASQRTDRIRLGVAVAVLPMRDPLLLAEDYAMVDRLSRGRLELGVGSGVSPVEYAALGIDSADKSARFAESLRVLRQAWAGTGGEVRSEGRTYGDLICGVDLVQCPTPPIWRAAGSAQSARAAGEEGDSVLFLAAPDLGNHREIEEMAAAHRRGLEAEGKRSVRAGAAVFTAVAATDEAAEARAANSFDRMATARGQEPQGQEVAAAAAASGRGFIGGPEAMAASLHRLEELGITDALLWLDFGGASETEIEESMRILASEVMPGFPG
ncbi:MAG: LLM class flavin-dependent oxidoreductase [Candidatus Eisenbacteria bacterium]|uniref:LLM class flavin-dependent oxidoreductase n=1 Tax=Eiseniibacteriota bacterium TaxID=2212470 RepID=A0A956SFT9_UNCEI|nr:LLM class flavin-dependent oxidoreductase [Candidatus Eisenbacteria bacterium]